MKQVIIFLLSLASSLSLGWTQGFVEDEQFATISKLRDANGVSVADYDQDGDLDLFLVSIHRYEAGNPQTWSRFFRNNGSQGFEDVTETAGLLVDNPALRNGWMGDRMAASWGDYDNDGFPDLFLSNNGSDELWHNEGDGSFRNVTQTSGVEGCFDCYSSNGLWWDYDLDGDLDLYVSDWLKDNRQYRNEGNGSFTDVSLSSGLNDTSKTWAAVPLDVNGDTYPDLYVVNDFGANFLFLNDGKGSFQESTKEYDLEDDGDGMGVDMCDYNNDGLFDIYVTNIFRHRPNPFFVGKEGGGFSERARNLGIDNTGWGWGARFFDADHDQDEDLYVVNGMNLSAGRGDENVFFENREGKFHTLSDSMGLNNDAIARGLEVFDYDLDGDLDLLVANRESQSVLYQNLLVEQSKNNTNWIQIILEGSSSNRDALGSVLRISCGGESYYRYHFGANLMGQSLKPLHLGLSQHPAIEEIEVSWPNGTKEYFPGIAANQLVRLKEGSGHVESILAPEPAAEETGPPILSPNPFVDQLRLQIQEEELGWIELVLTDLTGKRVFHHQQMVDEVSSLSFQPILPQGVYLYRLHTPLTIHTGKLLKK